MSEEPGSPIGDISRTTRVAFHDPATQIRLLHLDPSSIDDNISATLDVWDKDSAPSYNAISYVCGTSPARNVVAVNSQIVLVRDNCYEALQQANLQIPGCYIWVDAICINQDDLAEKSAQVAIMGEIYVKAAFVLACIGPTDPFVQSIRALSGKGIARDFTEHEVYQVERSTMMYTWYPDGLTCPETRFPATVDDEAVVKILLSEWHTLSLRPYFKRAWIVQELAGGKDHTIILCGQDKLDWNLLLGVGERLRVLSMNPCTKLGPHGCGSSLLAQDNIINQIGAGGLFNGYLQETKNLHCEDPRDRVFSVLSLVDWALDAQTLLLPDYSMTSFQLAFELISRIFNLEFNDVDRIIAALNLNVQYSEDMHSEVMSSYRCDQRSTTRQNWTQTVDGAYIIQRDSEGRLRVDLQSPLSKYEVDDIFHYRLPSYDYGYLATQGIFPVFAHGDVVALVCGPIRRGDVLLFGEHSDLVLRSCSDASTFGIVGAALAPDCFSPPWIPNACECWQADAGESATQRVEICLEVTREEVFADQLVRNATQGNCNSDCASVISYLRHHAIGSVRKGSRVQDVTAHRWPDGEVMGPEHPMCSAHLSSELHRVLRNPLWFTILSSTNAFVRTRKLPKSRTTSISSSEWVTEEE